MSRTFKLFKGSFIRTFTLFFRIAVVFFITPFTVKSLGNEMYGLWVLASSMTSYYFLLDFGVSQAVSRFVARLIGQKKKEEIKTIISNSVFSYLILSSITILLSLILILSLKFFVPADMLGLTRLLIIIVATDFCLTLPLKTFQGVLVAHIEYTKLSLFEIIQISLRSFLIVFLLNKGYGIIALALINFATNLLFHLSLFLFTKVKYDYVKIDFKLVNFKKIKEIMTFGTFVFLTQLGDLIRFKIGSFIIAGFVGLVGVTLYSIATKILDYFMQFIWSLVSVINPIFSRYEGANDYDSIREKFVLSVRISSIFALFGLANLIFFGKQFIGLWMGEEYTSVYPILIILAIPVTIDLSQTVVVGVLRSINKHHIYAIMNGVESIANLILSLLLAKRFGLMGVAIGVATPMFINNLFIQPIITCRYIKLNIKNYVKQILPIIFITFPFFGLIYFILYFIVFKFVLLSHLSYFHLIFLGGIEFLAYAALVYFFILKEKEKNYVHQILDKSLYYLKNRRAQKND